MDNDVSVCIIPDTPSPSVLGGKVWSRENQSVIEVPSDDSFRTSSTSHVNMHSEGLPHAAPTFATNSMSSLSDSPVFSCKRKLLDNKSDQNFDRDKHKINAFSAEVTVPPLPGSPEFSQERAKALKKKKMKNQLSPFTKTKYDLSPFKAGINRLSACSSKENTKKDLSMRWSPSPLETDVCNEKINREYSGFVKSSSLLGKKQVNSGTGSMSGIIRSQQDKRKKRKVETVSSHIVNDVVRPKVRRVKSTYGWLSSSDSSDDESLKIFLKNKKLKKTAGRGDKADAFVNRDMECVTDTTKLDSHTNSFPKNKVGKKKQKTWTVARSPQISPELSSNIPVLKLTAVHKDKNQKGRLGRKSSVPRKVRRGPIDYMDSSDDEFLSSVAEFSLPGDGKSGSPRTSGVSDRKSTLPTPQIQTQSQGNIAGTSCFSPSHDRRNISPMDWSPSDLIGTFYSSPTRSPILSSYPDRPSPRTAITEQPSTPKGRKKKKSAKSHTHFSPGAMLYSPVRHQRESSSNSLTGSPLGSPDNPIDLVSATPETRKALEEIKQLQADEEFARKMQEQLDLEFAMSLQNGEEHNTHRGSDIPLPQGATGHREESTTSNHWHAYSPARVRGSERGFSAGNRRRGRAGFDPDEAFVQLVRDTIGTLHTELGQNPNNLQFDGWLGHAHSPGRRRGGRRGRHVTFLSPAAGGEDYENLMNLAEMLGEVKDKGLSKSDLGRLPIMSYKKTEGQEIEECNICMTDYEDGDSQKILPCFHAFHSSCIDKWIKKNATCPICRVEVKVNSP